MLFDMNIFIKRYASKRLRDEITHHEWNQVLIILATRMAELETQVKTTGTKIIISPTEPEDKTSDIIWYKEL